MIYASIPQKYLLHVDANDPMYSFALAVFVCKQFIEYCNTMGAEMHDICGTDNFSVNSD